MRITLDINSVRVESLRGFENVYVPLAQNPQNYLAYGVLLLFTITADAQVNGLVSLARDDLAAGDGVLWRFWRIVEGKDDAGGAS